MTPFSCLVLFSLASLATCFSEPLPGLRHLPRADEAGLPDLYEASISELQDGLNAGRFSSVDLVKAYLARIDEVNMKGPALRAVLETNPVALVQAVALDKERKEIGPRSLLHGIPVLIKDNIATDVREGMNTTAGSYSLLGSVVRRDAGVVERLRAAGAIILGKANLSELAGFRYPCSPGWSGRGGQTTSAYYPNAQPCGSSSGSAVATSIGLAAVALGTEIDGSIACPSGRNNIVGIKPTVGLTSRAGIVPASISRESVGPMARTVTDAAIVLSLIAGRDSNDNYTLPQPSPLPDYTKALKASALQGKRIGVLQQLAKFERRPAVKTAFESALETIRELGATVVDHADFPDTFGLFNSLWENLPTVMHTEFKVALNNYFESLERNPSGVRSLADLVKYNIDHAELEMPPECDHQTLLSQSEKTKGFDSAYYAALAELGRTESIDVVLRAYELDAIVVPSTVSVTPSAAAGYPIVTVPLGFYGDNFPVNASETLHHPAPGVPFGLSFLGPAFSEFNLIGFGYAYEQKTKTRLARKAFAAAVPRTQLKDVKS